MSYPKDWPSFRAALQAYLPATEHADAIYAAQALGSPVAAAVATFEALKDAAGLDTPGRVLLAGAAYMIASGNFYGKGGEAAIKMTEVAPTLPAPVTEPEGE